MPQIPAPPGTLIVVDDAFAPVTVATDRDVLATPGATVTDTLQNRPGIVGTSFAPGANRPIIRGLDSYRVRVQENGIGAHDVSTISEDHAVPIDPFSADRIEVVRGPATLRYGSGAIGGVAAIENQRIPTLMPRNGVSGEIKGGLGSVDEGRDGAFRATAGAAGIVVHADAFHREAGDYDTPRGRQRNSFVDSEGLGLGLSRIWSDGFLGISVSRVDSVYGVPGEEADEGVDPRIDLAQQKVQLRGEWRPRVYGVDAVRFWFGASDYRHNELARHDGEDAFDVGSRFTNREQEGRFEVQHLPAMTTLGELTGAIGIQYGYKLTRGQSFEGESLLEPAQTRSLAAFWFEELRLSPSLQLQFASRIEQTAVDGRGWSSFDEGAGAGGHQPWFAADFAGERRFVPVGISLGALQLLPFGMVARVTGQYVERAPDAAELFSKGVHEATGTFEVGNPFIDKEKAFSLEVGLAKAAGPFRFDAAAFLTRYHGFIYRQLTGVVCEPEIHNGHFHCEEEDHHGGGGHGGHGHGHGHEHEFDLVFFRQRDATFYGVEVAAQLDVAPIWNGVWGIDGRYDFVDARFAGGENVPRIPPHRLGGGLYYRDANWFARAGVLHAFDQTRIGLEEIATPGYTLVSAELSYTGEVAPGNVFTLGVRGDNLADDEVLNHASFKRREDVLAPGASVRLFGSLRFD
ncbi:MAG: TonB-dependent receptor [Hyphomicrobiaceae bacterium]